MYDRAYTTCNTWHTLLIIFPGVTVPLNGNNPTYYV